MAHVQMDCLHILTIVVCLCSADLAICMERPASVVYLMNIRK